MWYEMCNAICGVCGYVVYVVKAAITPRLKSLFVVCVSLLYIIFCMVNIRGCIVCVCALL